MVDKSSPQSFSQLLDRGVPTKVIHARWCPTMDLLALVTADNQLHVHRLNWQRLWSCTVAAQHTITCLCWRPDGKYLAVGLQNGTVFCVSAEDGERTALAHPFEPNRESVAALSWSVSKDARPPPYLGAPTDDRSRRLFEPPLPMPACAGTSASAASPAGYAERLGNRDCAAWPLESHAHTIGILTCVSTTGHVVLCSESLHTLINTRVFRSDSRLNLQVPQNGHLRSSGGVGKDKLADSQTDKTEIEEEVGMSSLPADNHVVVLHATMPQSLKEISVCSAGMDGSLRVSIIETPVLASNVSLLMTLSRLTGDILGGVRSSCDVFKLLLKEWNTVEHTRRQMVDEIDKLLTQHNIESDAQSDLLLLVTMGEYSSAMEQYLNNSLGESGIKRIARTVDAAFCAAHALLVDKLVPDIELLAFRLGELRGLAATPKGRALFGLRGHEVGNAERIALHLLSQLERLRQGLVSVGVQYRTFFSWLTSALRRFAEDTVDTLMGYPLSHIDTVRDFLHDEFMQSALERLLFDPGQDDDPKGDHVNEIGHYKDGDLPEGVDDDADDFDFDFDFDFAADAHLEESFMVEHIVSALECPENVGPAPASASFDGGRGSGGDSCLGEADDVGEGAEQKANDTLTSDAKRSILGSLECRLRGACRRALSRSGVKLSRGLNKRVRTWLLAPQGWASSSRPGSNATTVKTPRLPPTCLEYEYSVGSDSDETLVAVFGAWGPVPRHDGDHSTLTPVQGGGAAATPAPAPAPAGYLVQVKMNTLLMATPAASATYKVSIRALPPQFQLVDIGLYKNGAVALLLQSESAGVLALTQGEDTLHSVDVPCNALEIITSEEAAGKSETSALEAATAVAGGQLSATQLLLEECRTRTLPYLECSKPLAVSAARGVGFALSGVQRAVLLDLEEDEEGEGEGEGEEEQESEGAHMVTP